MLQSLRKILFPFALLYDGLTRLRNFLYDQTILSSEAFDLPVICVGNLSVGGTGKTPMVEFLIRLLKEEYQVAVLSRGYGRKTHQMEKAGLSLATKINVVLELPVHSFST